MTYLEMRTVGARFRDASHRNFEFRVARPFTNMQTLIAETIILCDIAGALGPLIFFNRESEKAKPRDGS